MHIEADELNGLFSAAFLLRGRNYHLQERVQALELRHGTLFAEVQGSEPEPYYCEIELGRQAHGRLQVRGHCTCPMAFNCKHVVAALFAWSEHGQAPTPESLAGGLMAWLDRLEEAGRRGSPAPSHDQLLYLLEHDGGHGPVWITPIKARRLKKGGYGRGSPYRGQGARFLDTRDHGLLARLRAGGGQGRHRLSPEDGDELLRELLATGRCHFGSIHDQPLREGPARPGSFDWELQADGQQALVLHPQPTARVLPLAPPWYLDPEQGLCGPIATDYPAALSGALLQAPRVPAEEAPRLAERLGRLSPQQPLPLPRQLTEEAHDDIAPVPCLRLESLALDRVFGEILRSTPPDQLARVWDYTDDAWLHRALLRFDYAGHRVSAADRRQRLMARHGDALWSIRRHHDAEHQALQQLLRYGLQPFGDNGFVLPEPQGWGAFVYQAVPQLRAAGWQVELAPEFQFAVAEPEGWYADVEETGGEDWFGLDLGVIVDGERINLLPLLAGMLRDLPNPTELSDDRTLMLTLDDGRLLPVPGARIRPLLQTLLELYQPGALDDGGRLRLSRLHSQALATLEAGAEWDWQGGTALLELGERLAGFQGIARVPPPAGLEATLRDYQQAGLDWLQFLREYRLNGVLADDMGLGKTVQTLAHLLKEKEAGRADRPSLVVVPTSLLSNWRQEARRLAPSLRVLSLHGPQRQAGFAAIPEHDLVLTTYPLLGRDLAALAPHEFHLLILDEAQHIKNPRAQAASAARQLAARHRLCLTGTPLENNLGELWSLFHFLMPGLLGDRERFRRLFRTPIEKHADPGRREQLRRRVAPFMLRRTKDAVAAELPGKTELVQTVELSDQQRDLYETVRLAMHERIQSEIARKGAARSHIVILDALLKLRQICCDPRLVKLEAARRVQGSAKLELLLEMLPELISEGRRILLFSQFTGMLALIEEALAPLRIPYAKLTGQTRDRAGAIERFQSGEVPLFLISLKAGGTGLNLTAADTVIHYDPWWNPAVERQATDRAYRIGQDKPVFVYKLISEGTVEERMAALQARKQALSDALLAEDSGGPALTAEDLAELFQPLG